MVQSIIRPNVKPTIEAAIANLDLTAGGVGAATHQDVQAAIQNAIANLDLTPSGIGAEVAGAVQTAFNSTDNVTAYFNKQGDLGRIVDFRYNGNNFVSIGIAWAGGDWYMSGHVGSRCGLYFNASGALPMRDWLSDNTVDLGQFNYRWNDIYATNGTIQTSDIKEKQDIEELTDAEIRVAKKAKTLLRKFKWKSSVAEKGDNARIHFGIIAQNLQKAFEDEGLDASKYAMFIHNKWWEIERVEPAQKEIRDEQGNIIQKAAKARTVINTFNSEEEAPKNAISKNRMGIHYSELEAFIIAGM